MEKKKFKFRDYKEQIDDWTVYQDLTPRQAIKAYCKQCCCYNTLEVILCPAKSCPLYLIKQKIFKNSRTLNKSTTSL